MNYNAELTQFIQTVKTTQNIPDYFIELFEGGQRFESNQRKKKVGIIGDAFYSLYVRASGLTPVFLNGGSYFTGESMADIFPQISDPVAKSSLGLLMDEELGLYKKLDAVIVVVTNDSYKKAIPYLTEKGLNIIEVEPPSLVMQKMPKTYVLKQVALLNSISKIANTRLSEPKLRYELAQCKRARSLTTMAKWQSLPTLTQDFLMHTLLLAEDKEEWMEQMGDYLRSIKMDVRKQPVLLMGSALQFPCTKMYEIFGDVGVTYFHNACATIPAFYQIAEKSGGFALLNECFKVQYKQGFSSETLANTDEYRFPKGVQGIVYHLLKGQVSSAYEAEQMEKAAFAQNVPFLCVETDYTYADKEQIKIRVEAFCEMLRSKGALAPVQIAANEPLQQ